MNEEIEKLIDQHGVYPVLQSISEIAARRSRDPSAKQIIALWGASAISRRHGIIDDNGWWDLWLSVSTTSFIVPRARLDSKRSNETWSYEWLNTGAIDAKAHNN